MLCDRGFLLVGGGLSLRLIHFDSADSHSADPHPLLCSATGASDDMVQGENRAWRLMT